MINLAVVYQVIFHYRVPFYIEMDKDEDLDFSLFYGSGVSGAKLHNSTVKIPNSKKLITVPIGFGKGTQRGKFTFFPFLFFNLIKENPQIVLAEGFSSILNFMTCFLYAKIFRKKIILWSLGKVRGKKLSRPRVILDNFLKFLERKSDAVFTYSTVGEQYFIQRGVQIERIFKSVNVVDTRPILKQGYRKTSNSDCFRVLFVGSVIKEKKLEVLLNSFLKLERRYSNVYLDIVGSGDSYYNQLKGEYENQSSNIIFHGRVIDELDEIYRRSDVFVLPGLGGLAIAESMAYGVPVICSLADGTELDLITNNNNGFILDVMDEHSLGVELEKLMVDRERLRVVSMAAYKTIKEKYNFESYYSNFKRCIAYLSKK